MKIIITILVVLLGLSGGAYYAQDSGLYDFKQLKQYIPSQVQEILNIEDTEVVSMESVESDELELITDVVEKQNSQMTAQESPLDGQNQVLEESNTNSQESVSADVSIKNSAMEVTANREANNAEATNGNVSKAMPKENNQQNIQTAMLDSSFDRTLEAKASTNDKAQATQGDSNLQVLDASPEEMKMVKQLNKIEQKIVKLDDEKEILERKYNQMIKKNRELALRIRDIDQQIKAIDEK